MCWYNKVTLHIPHIMSSLKNAIHNPLLHYYNQSLMFPIIQLAPQVFQYIHKEYKKRLEKTNGGVSFMCSFLSILWNKVGFHLPFVCTIIDIVAIEARRKWFGEIYWRVIPRSKKYKDKRLLIIQKGKVKTGC